MKNLLKMAFIAAAFFVTSCGKSDDGVSNKDLVGTWTAVSIFEGERSEELMKRTTMVSVISLLKKFQKELTQFPATLLL